MVPPCVVTLSDSRGRGLSEYLRTTKELPEGTIYRDSAIGGATLDRLFKELRTHTRDLSRRHPTRRIIVTLNGGLCNLTRKTRGRGKEEVLYSPTDPALVVNSVQQTIDDIIEYTNARGYYLIIATILPVSLSASRDHLISNRRLHRPTITDVELQRQQADLDRDVQLINSHIENSAVKGLSSYVNFHRQLEQISLRGPKSKKTRRITIRYDRLADGIHPAEALQTRLNKKLLNAVLRHLATERRHPELDTTQSEDTDPEPAQKRGRTT